MLLLSLYLCKNKHISAPDFNLMSICVNFCVLNTGMEVGFTYNQATVPVVIGKAFDVCYINLKPGRYIILSHGHIDTDIPDSLISVGLDKREGKTFSFVNWISRGPSSAGGGVSHWTYVDCITDCKIMLYSHGYVQQACNYTGTMIALKCNIV